MTTKKATKKAKKELARQLLAEVRYYQNLITKWRGEGLDHAAPCMVMARTKLDTAARKLEALG